MRHIILKEVHNVIPEAKNEPTATIEGSDNHMSIF